MAKKKKQIRLSILFKAIVLILVFAGVIVATAMGFFAVSVSRTNRKEYINDTTNLSATVAETIDVDKYYGLYEQVKTIVDNSPTKPLSDQWGSDEWNEYIAQFESIWTCQDFKDIQQELAKVAAANQSGHVTSVYLAYVDRVNELFVYVVDSADIETEDGCPPGCLDELYDMNKGLIDDPTIGFPAYITNTAEYGYLVTAGTPIYKGDTVVGYAIVDSSMTSILKEQQETIWRLFTYLILSVLLVSIIGIVVVYLILVRPVDHLTEVAKSYDRNKPEETHEKFSKINIKTHDEIADLGEALRLLESDVHSQVIELTRMNDELIASQNKTKEMTDLANKDGLTGVQNKISYNHEVEKMNKEIASGKMGEFAIAMVDLNYLKLTNDEFGHDAGDEALIKLSQIICDVFDHSPVYRIGGDEFVVILRKVDYRNVDELVNDFNSRINESIRDEKLSEFEKISAAIGFAKYNKDTDTCVDDVFKRADKAMYNRKRQMKNNY